MKTNKIFLHEIISNGSDALNKIHSIFLTDNIIPPPIPTSFTTLAVVVQAQSTNPTIFIIDPLHVQ
jgi:HSP90 family molecular chaperone